MTQERRPSGNEDVDKVRCRRCGFPGVDLKRDKLGPGSGLVYQSVTHTAATAPDEPVAVAGCPQCGCKNYLNYRR